MIDRGKYNLLGILINAIDYDAAVERIAASAQAGRAMAVSALAVHGVMTGVLDEVHHFRLNQFDLITPDGQPVRWALNLLHQTGLPDRVYGPTLTLKVCERAARDGLPIYLYGSQLTVIRRFAENLTNRFPNLQIAGMQPSRFRQVTAEEMSEIVDTIRTSGAKITLVGLGCPRQEVWAYENRKALSMPVLAVGAAFDFHAGTLSQAPAWMQQVGLEWLFRLVKEPRRLWRRYLLLNPLFSGMFFLQAARLRRFDPASGTPPTNDTRYG
ncbi:MAG: WecB/TagA/CpsF family glycosyltransferase [Anaerolineaceae bacterium]|jgi:exopolysaccharide biosynthesis WecB/TagA/CpsF family protein|nr:WecB/TagA/CpsF family glycosyltransferase [Anaerolineaceae bacterium]